MMTKVKIFSGAVLVFASVSASAGGLFGDGGLIRGDVGKFLDKNVEKPITTPIAKSVEKAVEDEVCAVAKAAAIAACVSNGGEPGACALAAEALVECQD